MAKMTMIEAIRDAHDVAMAADDRVVVFGEDVGFLAGCSAAQRACRKNTGNPVALTRRSTKAALLAQPSGWRPMG